MATPVEAQIAGSLWKIEKSVGDAVEVEHKPMDGMVVMIGITPAPTS